MTRVFWCCALALAGCGDKESVGVVHRDAGANGRDAAYDAATSCGTIAVETRRVTPTVLLLVDQSASMTENEIESGVTRWDAIKETLLARPGGILDEFETRVRFGLALYSALSTDMGEDSELIGACPRLTEVPPALSIYDSIEGVLRDADTLLDTPTSDALRAVLPDLVAGRGADPAIVVLATDGDPDTCAMPNPESEANRRAAMDESLEAVREAFAMDVRTFVIGVGEGSVTESHLSDLANAGVGVASGAPWWEAGATGGLGDALREIVGAEVSCTLEVMGRVVGDACSGTVELDGEPLECDGADGWRLVDESHVELVGDACARFRDSAMVSAEFPCDVILI